MKYIESYKLFESNSDVFDILFQDLDEVIKPYEFEDSYYSDDNNEYIISIGDITSNKDAIKLCENIKKLYPMISYKINFHKQKISYTTRPPKINDHYTLEIYFKISDTDFQIWMAENKPFDFIKMKDYIKPEIKQKYKYLFIANISGLI